MRLARKRGSGVPAPPGMLDFEHGGIFIPDFAGFDAEKKWIYLSYLGGNLSFGGKALPFGRMVGIFEAMGRVVEGAEGLGVEKRLVLLNAVFWAVGNYAKEHPEGLVRAADAALPLLKEVCRLEDIGGGLGKFGDYCEGCIGEGNAAKTYLLMKLLPEIGALGEEVFWSSKTIRSTAFPNIAGWDSHMRKAARNLVYSMSNEGNMYGEVFSPEKDASEAVREYLGREKNPVQVGNLFRFAYGSAIRGSGWGMEVASEMVSEVDSALFSGYEITEIRREAMNGCPNWSREAVREAERRAKHLEKLMRDKWVGCMAKRRGALGKSGAEREISEVSARLAVEKANGLLRAMNRSLRQIEAGSLKEFVRQRVRA